MLPVTCAFSPSGDSIVVQKNSSPPMSAAPSISTPFLPPSLMTLATSLARSLAAFSSAVGSGFFSGAGFSFFPPSFFGAFSCLPAELPAEAAGAGAAAGLVLIGDGSAASGREAILALLKLAMWLYQLRGESRHAHVRACAQSVWWNAGVPEAESTAWCSVAIQPSRERLTAEHGHTEPAACPTWLRTRARRPELGRSCTCRRGRDIRWPRLERPQCTQRSGHLHQSAKGRAG